MSMIERMARAIYCGRIGDPDYDFDKDPHGWHRGMHVDIAIAALKAIREPTEAMVRAGVKVLAEEWGVIGERAAEELAEIVYCAMIDAAISEAGEE